MKTAKNRRPVVYYAACKEMSIDPKLAELIADAVRIYFFKIHSTEHTCTYTPRGSPTYNVLHGTHACTPCGVPQYTIHSAAHTRLQSIVLPSTPFIKELGGVSPFDHFQKVINQLRTTLLRLINAVLFITHNIDSVIGSTPPPFAMN